MPPSTEPPCCEIIVELARTTKPSDPYAFSFAPQTYNVRKPDGTYGGATFPWDDAILADLAALQRRRQDPAVRARLGECLRIFLAEAGWDAREAEILAAANAGRPIYVTVRAEAAELHALPWELSTLRTTGQHLIELPTCLVRYEWPGNKTASPVPDPPAEGGRILFAWSAAGGDVPAAEHLEAIRSACERGHHVFDEDRDVIPHASLASVRQALAAPGPPVAVLHVLCHGGRLASDTEVYGLLWDASEPGDDPERIGALELRMLLAPHLGTLRLVVLAACHGATVGEPGNTLGGVAQALHRIGVPVVVASRQLLSVDGSIAAAAVLYDRLLVGLTSLESAFLAVREKVAEDVNHGDWAALQLHAREADGPDHRPFVVRPYRGLLAFQEAHAQSFFGRQTEIDEAVARFAGLVEAKKPRFLVVTGASGTGKSSLILAGVVPALKARDGGRWKVVSMRPRDGLATIDAALAEERTPLLFVVDQFEEIFTDVHDRKTREALVQRLWALAGEESSGVSVVVTLRVDYLGRCGEVALGGELDLEGVAYDEAHRVFVRRMARDGLRAIIEQPAAQAGLRLEQGLVTQMLADAGDEPGALPPAEYTLDQMWQARAREGARYRLTWQAYHALGGVTGALAKKADGLLAGLDVARQRAVRRLLVQLVDTRGDAVLDTRRRLRRDELRRGPEREAAMFDEVLDALARERLLVVGQEQGNDAEGATVEIAHEELVRRWGTLRGWLENERTQIEDLARLRTWVEAAKGSKSYVLRGDQLEQAKVLARKYRGELDAAERELIQRSTAEERRRRRRFSVSAGLGALVAALGYAAIADAGANVPKGNEIRQLLDRYRLSLVRPVYEDARVTQAARRTRDEILAAVRRARGDRLFIPADFDRDRPPNFDPDATDSDLNVWIHAQTASAVLAVDPRSRDDMARSLDALFKPSLSRRRVDSGWIGGRYTQAEPVLWVLGGVSRALAHQDPSSELVIELEKDLAIVQRMAQFYYLNPFDGGWFDYVEPVPRGKPSPYVTALALYALLDLHSAHLGWMDDTVLSSRMMTATAGWLDAHFDAHADPAGWRGIEGGPVVDGLTLFIFALRLRAQQEANLPIPAAILDRIPRYLAQCAARAASYSDQSVEPHSMIRYLDGSRGEASQTLSMPWMPWAIDASYRWLAHARVNGAPKEQVTAVRRALGHVTVDLRDASLERAFGNRVWYAAEMLHGLSGVAGDR
jgi:hypothetical protein